MDGTLGLREILLDAQNYTDEPLKVPRYVMFVTGISTV
jgi:hypothetical protein